METFYFIEGLFIGFVIGGYFSRKNYSEYKD